MPDRDGIRTKFPGAFKNCIKYANTSPAIMAQALHSTLTSTAQNSLRAGLRALPPLSSQLFDLVTNGNEDGLKSVTEIPIQLANRGSLVAQRCATEFYIDCSDAPSAQTLTLDEIKSALTKRYLVGMCDTQFLGILEIEGMNTYFESIEQAREFTREVKHELEKRLDPTVGEILQNCEAPVVTKVKMPKKEKRSEEDILDDVIYTNLEHI